MRSAILSPVFSGILLLEAGAWGAEILADHVAVDRFVGIPESVLPGAAALRGMVRHASVGGTINDGLECLQGTRENPAECRVQPDYRYDRRSWAFQPRGNSGWYSKVDDFVAEVNGQLDLFDVFSFKFCYLDGLDGLQEPCGSTLDPGKIDRAWENLRDAMESLEAAHPEKRFIWWTIPLTQVGQNCTDILNGRIRSHAREHGKILFDIADIESHDAGGSPHRSDGGLEVAVKELCGEQNPGAQACHPNWEGKMRLARAFWWLMARVSGWDGGSGSAPFRRGDPNADAAVDLSDAVHVLSWLFLDGPAPTCEKSGDSNDDGALDVSDAVSILFHLFAGSGPLPEPWSSCGGDPSEDALACASFHPCL